MTRTAGFSFSAGSVDCQGLADKEKAAENTLCILKGFDAV